MFSIVRDFNPEFSIKVKSSAILGQEDFVYGLMNRANFAGLVLGCIEAKVCK